MDIRQPTETQFLASSTDVEPSETTTPSNITISPSTAGLSSSKNSFPPTTQADKRKLANRIAAQASRDKAKKAKLDLEEENRNLRERVATLEEEVSTMKSKKLLPLPSQPFKIGAVSVEVISSQAEHTQLKSKYDQLLIEHTILKQNFEEKKAQCIVAFNEAELLQKKIIELKTKVAEQEEEIKKLEQENTDLLLPATPPVHQTP